MRNNSVVGAESSIDYSIDCLGKWFRVSG